MMTTVHQPATKPAVPAAAECATPVAANERLMLPAGVVQGVDEDNRKVFVSCSKDEVKQAPDYDERRRNEETYRKDVGSHYGSQYEGDPISPRPGPDLPPG